jgi:hypothetical protein
MVDAVDGEWTSLREAVAQGIAEGRAFARATRRIPRRSGCIAPDEPVGPARGQRRAHRPPPIWSSGPSGPFGRSHRRVEGAGATTTWTAHRVLRAAQRPTPSSSEPDAERERAMARRWDDYAATCAAALPALVATQCPVGLPNAIMK